MHITNDINTTKPCFTIYLMLYYFDIDSDTPRCVSVEHLIIDETPLNTELTVMLPDHVLAFVPCSSVSSVHLIHASCILHVMMLNCKTFVYEVSSHISGVFI